MPDTIDQPGARPKPKLPRGADVRGTAHGVGAGGLGGRLVAAVRSWARRTFSREQLGNGVRTLAWVAPLTIIIWVYAEREQAATMPNVRIGVAVESTDPGSIVTLADGADKYVTVTLSGPQYQLEGARDAVQYNGTNAPVRIPVSPKLGPGRHRIPAARVADDPRFMGAGVTVSNPQPDLIEVIIDPVVERDVPVRAERGFNAFRPPTFEPANVRVRGPAQVLDAVARDGLAVYAHLAERKELQQDLPTVTVKDVRLTVPVENTNVSIVGNPSVTATVTLARPEEFTLNFVPVVVTAPRALLEEYAVAYEDTVKNVTIVGPAEEIQKFRAGAGGGAPPVRAVFDVRPDVQAGTHAEPLRYDFGKLNGVVRVKEGAAPAQISYTLTRREGL